MMLDRTHEICRDVERNADISGRSGERLFAIVIVTFNSGAVLAGLLDSIEDFCSASQSAEVIVVDNNSRDDSIAIAVTHPVRPRIIQMGRNAGYAAAINAATATIDADTDTLILNPDVRVLPGTVDALMRRLSDIAVGVAVPRITDEDGNLAHSLRREPSLLHAWSDALLGAALTARLGVGEIIADAERYRSDCRIEWATGAIVAVAARARARVGDWDESFFLYSEEVDYLERVRRKGFAIAFAADATATHIGGEYRESAFLSALMATNRILYFGRHHGGLATTFFRLAIIVGEAIRAPLGLGHRAALRAALKF